MNYTQDGVYSLDLQSVAKRIYKSLLYRSVFYKFLNPNYIGELRNTGTPMIEVSFGWSRYCTNLSHPNLLWQPSGHPYC